MTVAAAAAKAGPYTGNDSASAFAFSFKVFADADIRVVKTVIATGVETDFVLNTDYTVTRNADQDASPGGSVTYKVGGVTTALPSTLKLTIVGDFDYAQPTDIPNGGSFFANVIETAFDRLTMLVKQLKVDADRSVKVDVSSTTDPDDLLDTLVAAAAEATVAAAAVAAVTPTAWTPAFAAAGATFAYAANGQVGSYTKIGQKVWITARLELAGAGNTLVGQPLTITGLPFACRTLTNLTFTAYCGFFNLDSSIAATVGVIESGDSAITMYGVVAAGGNQLEVFTDTVLSATAGSVVTLTMEYEAAA